MPSCAVPGCDGGTASSYQPFPKSGEDDRTKWFTALGLAEDGATDEDDLHVCSRHFKISDFVEKGVVRRGAVPCMRLTLKSNASPTRPSPPKKRKKSTSRELDHLEASNVIMDEQPSSRPSRRAARVAAQKITDTVRKYNLAVASAGDGADSDEDFDLDAEVRAEGGSMARLPVSPTNMLPKAVPAASSSRLAPRAVVRCCIVDRSYDTARLPLWLECQDEPLTQVQRDAHAQAQSAYNRSMRRINDAKRRGAKLIYCCPKDSYTPGTGAPATLKQPSGPALLNLVYDPRTGMLHSTGQAPLLISTGAKAVSGAATAAPNPTPMITSVATTVPKATFQGSQPLQAKPASLSLQQQQPPARQVPLITGGSTAVTANSLLMVKVLPGKVLPAKVLQEESQQLEAQYRRLVDGQNPVPWMAQRGVLPTDLPCKFCRSGRALLQPDASALNGYSLRCRAPGFVESKSKEWDEWYRNGRG